MRLYKKVLSTMLAASMTFSSVPVSAVSALDTQASSATNEVEEGATTTNEEENENSEEVSEETGEEEATEETAEENSEEQVEVQNLQDETLEASPKEWFKFDSSTGYITGFVTDSDVTDSDGNKFSGSVVVPEKIDDVTVKGLKNNLSNLTNADKVTSLDLSLCTGLEIIGKNAFSDCKGLHTVKFPTGDGVSYEIGESAFLLSNSQKPTSKDGIQGDIDLSGCNRVDSSAFYNCQGITSVNLTDCEYIDMYAFSFCTGLTSVDLTNCNYIGMYAFEQTGLTTVDLSVMSFDGKYNQVSDYIFLGCTSLTTVKWRPVDKDSMIGPSMFTGCTSLKYFNRDEERGIDCNLEGITKIYSNAFAGCTSLEPVIPTTVTYVGENAFDDYDLYDYRPETGGTYEKVHCDAPKYVTISADDETDLTSFCSKITSDNYDTDKRLTLKGLNDVVKIGSLGSNATGVSVDLGKFFNVASPDAAGTYYIETSLKDDYTPCDGYKTVTAYNISEKCIVNGNDKADSISASDIPVTFITDEYDSEITRYLSVDNSIEPATELAFEEVTDENGDILNYTCTVNVDISASGSDIADVELAPYVEISGAETVSYGDTDTVTYTVNVFPESCYLRAGMMKWTSDNTEVLDFYSDDSASGEATVKKSGEAGISFSGIVTKDDKTDYDVVASMTVNVNKATPTVTLENKTVTYTGSAVEIDPAIVTLVNNEVYEGEVNYTYYSDAECNNALAGAPTENGIYYVKASIAEQDNYTEAESNRATLTILSDPAADGNNGVNNGNPTTGDSAGLLAALGAGMAALGLGALSLKKKKKEEE